MGRVTARLDARGTAHRRRILEILLKAKRGHIGSAFSILEIIRVLYDDILRVDAKRPDWSGRDRFILSKGHGCLALYLLLAEKGFFDASELEQFSSASGILGGHPEHVTVPGVEASTGSLGHGLSIGVGMALAAKMDRADWRVYALIGDGESQEGSIWEAALSAAKHRLDNLTVILDYNKMQCYSQIREVLGLEPLVDKWKAFGFAVREIDGHDVPQIRTALAAVPFEKEKPSLILAHTLKGKGIPELEQNPDWHHKAKVSEEELKPLLARLAESCE